MEDDVAHDGLGQKCVMDILCRHVTQNPVVMVVQKLVRPLIALPQLHHDKFFGFVHIGVFCVVGAAKVRHFDETTKRLSPVRVTFSFSLPSGKIFSAEPPRRATIIMFSVEG